MSHHHCCSQDHSHGQSCCSATKSSGSCCSCHQQASCGSCCGTGQSSCQEGKGKGNYKHKFLALADEAWLEVLKEKIKEEIRKNSPHLDELARLISESNKEAWRHKVDGHQSIECYEEKIKQFFNCKSQSCENQGHHHNH